MGAPVSADRDVTLVIPQTSKAPRSSASGSRKLTDRMVRPAGSPPPVGVLARALECSRRVSPTPGAFEDERCESTSATGGAIDLEVRDGQLKIIQAGIGTDAA